MRHMYISRHACVGNHKLPRIMSCRGSCSDKVAWFFARAPWLVGACCTAASSIACGRDVRRLSQVSQCCARVALSGRVAQRRFRSTSIQGHERKRREASAGLDEFHERISDAIVWCVWSDSRLCTCCKERGRQGCQAAYQGATPRCTCCPIPSTTSTISRNPSQRERRKQPSHSQGEGPPSPSERRAVQPSERRGL